MSYVSARAAQNVANMERMINRPVLQVCSRCYRDFFRNACSTSTSSSSVNFPCSATTMKSRLDSDNLLYKPFSCPRKDTGIGCIMGRKLKFIGTPVSLSGSHLSLVRNFATEPEPGEKPIPNPLPQRKSKSKDTQDKSPITWKTLVLLGGMAGGLLLFMNSVKKEKEEARRKTKNNKMGKARLGGDWTLTNHNGKVQSSLDFRGQWLIIYFGFTNCPDICPEEMEKIVSVIEKTDADEALPKIQPIVITVDPERDTPEALKEYCSEFSPRLLGFSGSREQIEVATRAYRVYFSAGPKDEDNDYIVDHSIISYLINPEGEFVEYFGQNKKVDEIFVSAKWHILSYLKKKKDA